MSKLSISEFWYPFPDREFTIENMISSLDAYLMKIALKTRYVKNIDIQFRYYGVEFHVTGTLVASGGKMTAFTAERIFRTQDGEQVDMSDQDLFYISNSLR